MQENRSASGEEEGKGDIAALPSNLIEDKSTIKVETIGDLTPVQDFEAMFVRRDSPDWVVKAINDMKNKIFDLVEDSHEGDNYPKALECLAALRKGCVNEQVVHLPQFPTEEFVMTFDVYTLLIYLLSLFEFLCLIC